MWSQRRQAEDRRVQVLAAGRRVPVADYTKPGQGREAVHTLGRVQEDRTKQDPDLAVVRIHLRHNHRRLAPDRR